MPPRSQNKFKPRTHICLHKSCSKAFATRGGMRQHMSASHPDPRGFLPLQDSPAANPPLDNDFTEQDDGAHNDYSGPAMPRFNYHPVLDGMYCIITIYAQNNQGYDKGTPCDVDGIDLPACSPPPSGKRGGNDKARSGLKMCLFCLICVIMTDGLTMLEINR